MNLVFYKYQGAGNDFILIDNRSLFFDKENHQLIATLCNRNFGVGADGFILLENDRKTDFKMVYYNADGEESTMCGNGGRCVVAFAQKLKIIKHQATFVAIDGKHTATIDNNLVNLQMIDVSNIKTHDNYTFMNTGSPHHVEYVTNLKELNVKKVGKKLRDSLYGVTGSNINFVEQINNNTFKIRTYERGVEDETLACGTGATAVAIAAYRTEKTKATHINIIAKGGELSVSFKPNQNKFSDIYLSGNATFVFTGIINTKLIQNDKA